VLLGIPPQQLNDLLATTAGIPLAPEAIAVGIPAELLRRRPDVRRAERLVAAQSAQIGVAESDLYPRISLAGTLGWEAKSFSDMFNGSAFSGAIGPGFRWAVLNYGRLMSNVLAEDARFQQLVANYQQTVLRANEEAENAQVAYQHYLEQIKAREESVRQAEEAQRVAQIKYLEGEIDFNRLFTVQQLLLNQQELLAVARGNSARAVVDLYRALGGGWDWSVPELPYEEEVQLPISN
jgi:outer membrane protein TolC